MLYRREAALRAVAAGDVKQYHSIKNRSSVLAEWRRRVAAGGSNRSARDAALRLVEASRQIRGPSMPAARACMRARGVAAHSYMRVRSLCAYLCVVEGLMAPLTDADAIATERNTPLVVLYSLHVEMQRRVRSTSAVPSTKSEQEEAESLLRRDTASGVAAPVAPGMPRTSSGGGGGRKMSTWSMRGRPMLPRVDEEDAPMLAAAAAAAPGSGGGGNDAFKTVQLLMEVRTCKVETASREPVELYFGCVSDPSPARAGADEPVAWHDRAVPQAVEHPGQFPRQ